MKPIAPDFELKPTRVSRFQLSEIVGKKIIVLNFSHLVRSFRERCASWNSTSTNTSLTLFALALTPKEKQMRSEHFSTTQK